MKDIQQDESIEYRWSFTPKMLMQTKTVHAMPNLSLVPYQTDAGVYTCYANTTSNFTIESQGVKTTLTVLREYKHIFVFHATFLS